MQILPDKVESPLRKLRKSLKRLPKDPSVEGVHSLRTRARKVEAVSSALMQGHKEQTRAMLKSLKPLRKAAGKVRDMDVLIADALTLSCDRQNESLVRLVEHLGRERAKNEGKLLDVVASQKKTAGRGLRRFTKTASKWLEDQSALGAETEAAAAALWNELSRWPKFNRRNIHPFRIKVKELHYMLQLSADADRHLMSVLEKVKDRIGDWHDWQQLECIAGEVLDPRADRVLIEQIEETSERKLTLACDAASGLRRRYFERKKTLKTEHTAARRPAARPALATAAAHPNGQAGATPVQA